jgi:peptidoglycan hydrolase-like protein with peptidoglycan-binding domain
MIAQRCGDIRSDQCACHGNEPEEQVQRVTADDKTEGLTSAKYRGQPRLEAAFRNAPALGIGESGEGVRLVQEGLAAEGHALPKSTRPDGELDGKFGGETLGAVRNFQSAKSVPGGPDGRVGHNTMGKLDELAGSERKAKKGPADVCSDPPCGDPYVEIKPGMFVSLCSSKLKTTGPVIRMSGCLPGRQGIIGFFTGQPAWQLDGGVNICGPLDKSIEIGYIQTVAAAVNMSVYRDPKTGLLTTGQRECVSGARDCLGSAPAPWYDAPGNNFGPQKLGVASPVLVDTPNMPQLKSREPGKGNLQNIFFQGVFHVWLIARLPGGKLVFIHHWDIALFARAMLNAGADPCNISQWAVDGGANDAGNGPGPGSASPALTGNCARTLAKPC